MWKWNLFQSGEFKCNHTERKDDFFTEKLSHEYKMSEADGHTVPLPAFSSLLVDLGIFFSDVSDLVDFLSSVLWPLTSPWPLSSVPGVVALCRSGEGGYWPGEQGDWARLLFDLTLNTNTATSGHLDSNPSEVCRCYLCVCVFCTVLVWRGLCCWPWKKSCGPVCSESLPASNIHK